jgi:streptogramin lyase
VITLLFISKRVKQSPRTATVLILVSLLSLAGLMLAPAKAVIIYEYGLVGTPVPWEITFDKDGVIWFTEQSANKIAKLSGPYEWTIPTPGSVPWGIAGSKDHAYIWFTEETAGKIARFNPTDGTFQEWTLPDFATGRPRGICMNITKLSTGKIPANSVWFTEFGTDRIGYLYLDETIPSNPVAQFSFYSLPADSHPLSIAMSPIDNSVWFTEYGKEGVYPGKIGCVKILDNGNVIIKHYDTSWSDSKPWGIAIDPSGFVWVAESAAQIGKASCIGKLNPVTGEYVTFAIPTPNAEPHGIALEAYTTPPYNLINVWFTEYNSDKIGKYSPTLNVFFEYPVITAGSRPHGIVVSGPGGSVCFTEPFAQKIGLLYQSDPWVTYTTVGTITSATTTSTTVATQRGTAGPAQASTTAAITSSVTSTPAPVTIVTATRTLTISQLYVTSTSIYSYTLTSYTTSYTTSSTTTTATQTLITVSTLSTSTTTTATSTSIIAQTSTLQTSITVTSVGTSTSLTSTTLTATSTSMSPTVTVTVANTSFLPTTTYSPTVTVTSLQTSLIPTTTIVTSTLTTSTTTTTTVAVTRPCIIASAAYGSELAPEVQFLREFRDGSVISTFAGGRFMRAFNEFYYSFSPTIARTVAANPVLSATVRLILFPLLAALHSAASVFKLLHPFNLEFATVLSGILASSLIGVFYMPPIVAARMILRRKTKLTRRLVC